MAAGIFMSSKLVNENSIVLCLEFSIADAVRHRGLFAVLSAAVRAWWALHPVRHSDVPDYLRADVGLEPEASPAHWTGIDLHTYRLQPPDRRWP